MVQWNTCTEYYGHTTMDRQQLSSALCKFKLWRSANEDLNNSTVEEHSLLIVMNAPLYRASSVYDSTYYLAQVLFTMDLPLGLPSLHFISKKQEPFLRLIGSALTLCVYSFEREKLVSLAYLFGGYVLGVNFFGFKIVMHTVIQVSVLSTHHNSCLRAILEGII